jgi:hypothetical protein
MSRTAIKTAGYFKTFGEEYLGVAFLFKVNQIGVGVILYHWMLQ